MKSIFHGRRAGSLLAALVLAACSQSSGPPAREPAADAFCALDGMVLADFPGPKAQVWYDGNVGENYCDLMELFAQLLAPEQKRVVRAAYVQDMGAADWTQPKGHWINARDAYYVAGSRKMGSMGPTFGSFAQQRDAEAFARAEGGQVLRFGQVTLAMTQARMGGGAAHADRH
jgi:copper chaperone NosL